jgi:hypothetical protein
MPTWPMHGAPSPLRAWATADGCAQNVCAGITRRRAHREPIRHGALITSRTRLERKVLIQIRRKSSWPFQLMRLLASLCVAGRRTTFGRIGCSRQFVTHWQTALGVENTSRQSGDSSSRSWSPRSPYDRGPPPRRPPPLPRRHQATDDGSAARSEFGPPGSPSPQLVTSWTSRKHCWSRW